MLRCSGSSLRRTVMCRIDHYSMYQDWMRWRKKYDSPILAKQSPLDCRGGIKKEHTRKTDAPGENIPSTGLLCLVLSRGQHWRFLFLLVINQDNREVEIGPQQEGETPISLVVTYSPYNC